MKIRLGFVSNSSTASYRVPVNNVKNTTEIAMSMVMMRDFKYDEKTLENLEIVKDILPKDAAITFLSTNFDTHIFPGKYKDKDVYFVNTCNNHPFNLIDELIPLPEDDWPRCDDVTAVKEYYDADKAIHYRLCSPLYNRYCENNGCHGEYVILTRGEDKGKKVCLQCYTQKLKEKEKDEKRATDQFKFEDEEYEKEFLFLQHKLRQAVKNAKNLHSKNTKNKEELKKELTKSVEDICIALMGPEFLKNNE